MKSSLEVLNELYDDYCDACHARGAVPNSYRTWLFEQMAESDCVQGSYSLEAVEAATDHVRHHNYHDSITERKTSCTD